MRRLLLTLILIGTAARAEAIPIHPNMISVEFGTTTLSHPLPPGAQFSMVNGTYGLRNPSTGFFGSFAGTASVLSGTDLFSTTITIAAIERVWNANTPDLVASDATTFSGSFGWNGVDAIFFLPAGGYFSAASFPYRLIPDVVQATNWDGHMPLTIEADNVTAVPEPCSLLLLGTGLAVVRARRRR